MSLKSITLILFIALVGCSSGADMPEESVIRNVIAKTSGIGGIYNLDTYEITNSYSREVDGEEHVTIEYQGVFNMKDQWKGTSTFSADPEQVTKPGSITVVKRGSKWYF